MGRVLTNEIKFKNRDFEFQAAHNKLAEASIQRPHLLIFWSKKSYGSTAFLHELKKTSKSFHSVYLDCKEKSVDGFLRDFILSLRDTDPRLHDQVVSSLDNMGNKIQVKSIVDILISYVPYVSDIYLKILKPKKSGLSNSYKVNFSPNQILARVSKHLTGKNLTLLLDNLDELDAIQFKFISELMFYLSGSKINFIACQNSASSTSKQAIYFHEAGCEVQSQEFKALTPDIMVKLASERDVLTSVEEWERFGDKDIYSCLEHIYSKLDSEKALSVFEGFDPLSIYIIKLLASVDQPIKEELLIRSVLDSKQVVSFSIDSIRTVLLSLEKEGVIECFTKYSNHFFRLQRAIRGQVISRLPNIDLISFGSELYESCNKMISETDIGINIADNIMLYFLSLKVDPDASPNIAKDILTAGMREGENPEFFSWIKEVVNPRTDFSTYLFCLTAGMNIKDYSYVLKTINESTPAFKISSESLLLEGITLNRLRKYSESENRLCLIKARKYQVIVGSYRLINLFHTGHSTEAREYFLSKSTDYNSGDFFIYFQRIGAGLLPAKEGILLLNSLLKKENLKRDRFGYYTTMANLGALLHKSGRFKEGRQALEKSYRLLLPFGPSHITHCALSLSVARCVDGDYLGCIDVTKKIILQPEDSHYVIAAKLNEAAALFLLGKYSDSLNLYDSILDQVINTPTWNVKSRYFINFALAKCVAGQFDKQLNTLLEQAKLYKHNNSNHKWRKAFELASIALSNERKITLEDFTSNLLWGYFEYWWFTPQGILDNHYAY